MGEIFKSSDNFEACLNNFVEWFINDSGALDHFSLEAWKNIGIGVLFIIALILLIPRAYKAWQEDKKKPDQPDQTTTTQPTQTAPTQPAADVLKKLPICSITPSHKAQLVFGVKPMRVRVLEVLTSQ